jgi:hypothetical protein
MAPHFFITLLSPEVHLILLSKSNILKVDIFSIQIMCVSSYTQLILLDQRTSFERIFCLYINPMLNFLLHVQSLTCVDVVHAVMVYCMQ